MIGYVFCVISFFLIYRSIFTIIYNWFQRKTSVLSVNGVTRLKFTRKSFQINNVLRKCDSHKSVWQWWWIFVTGNLSYHHLVKKCKYIAQRSNANTDKLDWIFIPVFPIIDIKLHCSTSYNTYDMIISLFWSWNEFISSTCFKI